MKSLARWAFVVFALLSAAPVHAQGVPLILEIRGVGGYPVGEFGEDDVLGLGYGYGLGGRLRLVSGGAIYAGWERIRFDGDSDGAPNTFASTSDTAVRAGLEAGFELPGSDWGGFVFGGGILGEAQSEIREGDITFVVDSDWEIGYEAGAGISTVFGGLTLRPSVAFRAHSTNFEPFSGFPGREMTVSYVVVAVGISPRG